jgi:hypothetical protein
MTANEMTESKPSDPDTIAVSLINHLRQILAMIEKKPRQRRSRSKTRK